MPLYFFHLRDHREQLLDPQGLEIDDPASVPAQALKEARAIISQDALKGVINLDQRIEVEDRDRRLVCRLPFAEAVRIIHGEGDQQS